MSPKRTSRHIDNGADRVSKQLTFPGDGDESAVAQFWTEVQNRVSILARHWGKSRGLSRDDVEEIGGAATLRLMHAAPFAALTKTPVRWAYLSLAVQSAMTDFLRSRAKEHEALERFSYALRGTNTAAQAELRCVLNDALRSFNPADQQLLIGRLLYGKSIQELADERESTYVRTARQLSRLFEKLRMRVK